MFNTRICGDSLTIDSLNSLSGPHMQRVLSSLLDHKIGRDFHTTSSSKVNRVRKLSTRCPESSGFLRATPVPHITLMNNETWCLSNRLRLGLPLTIIPENVKCICKGRPRVDQKGYHLFNCKNGK
jgi:hypothetical protein